MSAQIFYTFNNQDSKDYTENGRNGTDTSITYTTGDVGYNAVFNAVTDGISFGTFTALNGLTEVAFYLRLNLKATTGTKCVLFKQGQFNATWDGTTFTFNIIGVSGTSSVSFTPTIGTYYSVHVNYIHNGLANDCSMYVDGVIEDSTTTQGALVTNSNVAYVGGDAGLGLADTANFEINELKIFNTSLSSLQMGSHVDNVNGLILKTTRNEFALGDIICSKPYETNKGLAIVSYVGNNEVRVQPLNAYFSALDSFVRMGNLWNTSRQYSVQVTSTGINFYNGVALSSQIFSSSKLVKSDTIDSNSVYNYGTLSTSLNDWDIPVNNFISINAGASAGITGISSKSYPRRVVLINRNSSNTIRLYNNSGSSTTANRFDLTADYDIPANKSVEVFYDTYTSRWRIIKE